MAHSKGVSFLGCFVLDVLEYTRHDANKAEKGPGLSYHHKEKCKSGKNESVSFKAFYTKCTNKCKAQKKTNLNFKTNKMLLLKCQKMKIDFVFNFNCFIKYILAFISLQKKNCLAY